MRIGLRGDRDQHGGDAGKADEAALYGVVGFTQRLRVRKDPAQDEKDEQQGPDDRREREHGLADDRREMPDLVRGAPGVAETCEPQHDAEEGGRHDRRLESVAHRLSQISSRRQVAVAAFVTVASSDDMAPSAGVSDGTP